MAPAYIKVPGRDIDEDAGLAPKSAHMATTTLRVGGMTYVAPASIRTREGFK